MILERRFTQLIIDAYFVFALILGSDGFGSLILGPPTTGATSSPVYTVLWGFIYGVSLLRMVALRHYLWPLLRANRALVFLVLVTCASWYWSIERPLTLHGSVTLLLTTCFAMDFSFRYTMKRQLELLCVALGILMLCSVVAEVVFPGFVPVEQADGLAWHGVFKNKNNFGRMICLAVVSCIALTSLSKLRRGAVLLFGVALAYMSKAMSFLLYTVFLSGTMATLSVLKWRPKQRLAAIVVILATCVGAISYAAQNFSTLLAAMDKDPHLTGRVDLWQGAIVYIRERPLLGYGADAFWGVDSQPARRIREAVNWDEAPHAHNAYIDYALSTGLVGLAAYLLVFFTALVRAFGYFMQGPETERRWPITFLVFVFLYQFTESGIVGGGNILWMLFASVTFSMSFSSDEPAAGDAQHWQSEAA